MGIRCLAQRSQNGDLSFRAQFKILFSKIKPPLFGTTKLVKSNAALIMLIYHWLKIYDLVLIENLEKVRQYGLSYICEMHVKFVLDNIWDK